MRRSTQTVLVRSLKNPLITRRMTVHSAKLNSFLWEPIQVQPVVNTSKIAVTPIEPEGDYNVIAVIPINGRLPLVRHTIERLLTKNNIVRVVCVVSNEEDTEFILDLTKTICCISVVSHENKPLGAKWNAGFIEAKKYDPDACLFVGSSDWVSDNWVSSLLPLIDTYDMVGAPGCYLLDIQQKDKFRLVNWGGYTGERSSESIGIGRLLSSRILNKIGWKPFIDNKDGSLDYAMINKVAKAGGKIGMFSHPELIGMAISTDQWVNKHTFEKHWDNTYTASKKVPIYQKFLKKYFDEYDKIF